MANVNFRPNKGKTVNDITKPQKIYIRYRLGAKVDFNASTGASVLIENWDFDKQRVKNRSHVTDRNEINTLLSNLTTHFETFEAQNLKDGITPTYEMVKTYFDSFFTEPEQNTNDRPITFFDFVDSFIEKAKSKPNRYTKENAPVKSGTINGYLTALNLFKRYNDEVQKFDFEDIDLHFYNKFSNWCDSLNFTKGYKGKNIKTLKVFMNAAVKEGATTNEKFRDSEFMVLRETADSIYLNLDELRQMWQLDLTNDPTKERARDLFLIGCFTGLRVSDYNNLKPSNIKEIDGVKILSVKTQKTATPVAIPLHPIVEAILTNYNGIPPRMYDQKINQNIKEVARLTGLDEVVETQTTIGGKVVTKRQPKYQMVCTHTARRSFCTNAYLTGMDSLDIMAISGHTTEKDFRKYIKVTPEQRAVKMSQNAFFTNATALKVV
jgi:site-specific recombinase XerD